ncbi:MAG: hypothetical protein ABEJ75_03240 [Candidatus Nanohaloarchaea archaeon]
MEEELLPSVHTGSRLDQEELLETGRRARLAAANFLEEVEDYRFLFREWRRERDGKIRREALNKAYNELPEALSELNPLLEEGRQLQKELRKEGINGDPGLFNDYSGEPVAFRSDEILVGDEIRQEYRRMMADTEELYREALNELHNVDSEFYDELGETHSGATVMEYLPLEYEPRSSFR